MNPIELCDVMQKAAEPEDKSGEDKKSSSDEDSSDDESVEAVPVVKKIARPQGRCVIESCAFGIRAWP